MLSAKLAFIGAGNMARSIIGGLIDDGFSANDIHVASRSSDKLQQLQQNFAIQVHDSNQAATQQAEIIILAVKPQQLQQVIKEIAPVWQPHQLLVSVAAGIRIEAISHWLNADNAALVRAMPNTPALVKFGATGLYANKHVSAHQKQQVTSLLSATGMTLWVDNEKKMDTVTALSGSGPAYFFLVMEAMQAAAEQLGLSPQAAEQLTLATALGAATMANQSDLPTKTLRQQVTSPGGTTEQALNVFEQENLKGIFKKAMQAAADRADQLANQLGKNDDQ